MEGVPANTFRIVSLQGGSSNTLSTATQGKLAIQSTVINNDQVEVTTVIPYKVTASGELVNYESAGELFAYPECMAQNALDHRLAYDYLIGSYINEENPPENELYVSMQAPMPQNRVLYLSDGMFHGGVVYVELEYSANGNDRNDFDAYEIYRP